MGNTSSQHHTKPPGMFASKENQKKRVDERRAVAQGDDPRPVPGCTWCWPHIANDAGDDAGDGAQSPPGLCDVCDHLRREVGWTKAETKGGSLKFVKAKDGTIEEALYSVKTLIARTTDGANAFLAGRKRAGDDDAVASLLKLRSLDNDDEEAAAAPPAKKQKVTEIEADEDGRDEGKGGEDEQTVLKSAADFYQEYAVQATQFKREKIKEFQDKFAAEVLGPIRAEMGQWEDAKEGNEKGIEDMKQLREEAQRRGWTPFLSHDALESEQAKLEKQLEAAKCNILDRTALLKEKEGEYAKRVEGLIDELDKTLRL